MAYAVATMKRKKFKALLIFGTRPEAIKMAPLVFALNKHGGFTPRICVAAQHREMLDQVMKVFRLKPHHDLNIMRPGQSLFDITSLALKRIRGVLDKERPDIVLVQGDTTTTFVSSLVAFYSAIPVGHIEAGLRTGRRDSPFPEEMNRLLTTRLADLHFTPTKAASEALMAEGIPANSVYQTGNTVVDSVHIIRDRIMSASRQKRFRIMFPFLEDFHNFVLVTAHRRESFGEGMKNICNAVSTLASLHPEIAFVLPMHLNPNVKGPVRRILARKGNIRLLEPLDYESFIFLMSQSRFILTDSGGVQEEAPSFRKPVLIMRDVTERMEAVEAGVARLIGTRHASIVAEANRLLVDDAAVKVMQKRRNPFGDGRASDRIVKVLSKYLQ